MTREEIAATKAEYQSLCREYIKRDGLEELLAYLETTDFYTAPSSTMFHLNEEGGLCSHSINVFRAAKSIYDGIAAPAELSGQANYDGNVSMESIAISTLFHDLCKTKLYRPTEKWKKSADGRWESYMGYEVQDEFPFGHGEKSCLIISWYMRLRRDELLAIRWHMGMFDMGEQGSAQRYAFRAALEKSPLVTIVHAADFIASNLLEKTTKH